LNSKKILLLQLRSLKPQPLWSQDHNLITVQNLTNW